MTKSMKIAMFLFIGNLIFYVSYNSYFGWNVEPKSTPETVCDIVHALTSITAWIIFIVSLLRENNSLRRKMMTDSVPPPFEKPCPLCNTKGEIVLSQVKYNADHNGKNYSGFWWRYKCEKCGESFTTTESDTISVMNLKTTKL